MLVSFRPKPSQLSRCRIRIWPGLRAFPSPFQTPIRIDEAALRSHGLRRPKLALAFNVVKIYQQIRRTIAASTMPIESFTHNSWPYISSSRPKAVTNDMMLVLISDRPCNERRFIATYAQSNSEYGKLYRVAKASNPRPLPRYLPPRETK